MPWETAGGQSKGGGKWVQGRGKGKANQRKKRKFWNNIRKEWLLNLPVCENKNPPSIRQAPRYMINVKNRCEYLKHLPTHLGDTMENSLLGEIEI